MKDHNKLFILELFCILIYIFLLGSVLCTLVQINKATKEIIFKHYGVPLK